MQHAKRLALSGLVLCALGALAPPTSAQTAPGYEQFAGCPDQPDVFACVRSETNSGFIQIGNTNTPINRQIVLSGGLRLGTGEFVYSSQGGLHAPPLRVPGGLTGLTGLPEFLINLLTLGAHEVHAQAVLVGNPELSISGDQINLILPTRLRLLNPFLRSSCSIGSASNPVTFHLTTGTTAPPPPNQPINGVLIPPQPDPSDPENLVISSGNVLVDNAFAAPAASGCDLIGFGLINGLVNSRVGLPSAAGRNTAKMENTTVKLGNPAVIYP
jgi:hypothetical protein